jgi:hypothetical protein
MDHDGQGRLPSLFFDIRQFLQYILHVWPLADMNCPSVAMAKGYPETPKNSRKLPVLPVPGGKKTFYAHEVSIEEQDLKAHRQDQKVSGHIGNADFIRSRAQGKTATADIDASVEV